jgi:pimeloyl-ACP methyl ester carboxylesterase
MSNRWIRGALWAGVSLAGMAVVNAEIARRVDPLDPAGPLAGEAHYYQWSLGRVFYTVEGQGRPLVLIHGFGVGADSNEWRHIFKTLSQNFRVYAYDQLGFGLSDRPDITYSPDLYVRLQRDFLRDVVRGTAMVVASALTCPHTVLAASLYPTLFENLVLVHPARVRGILSLPGWKWSLLYTALRSPVVGEILVNAIASRSSIRHQLGESLFPGADRVDEYIAEVCYASSHQPGARHAIAAYVSGFLDADIRLAFARLRQPVTVVWGKNVERSASERVDPLMALNPSAHTVVLDNTGQDIANQRPQELVALIREAREA